MVERGFRSIGLNEQRTLDQNKKFHAMLTDIAKQVVWDGDKHDQAWWKFIVLGAAYGQVFVRNPFGEGFVCANKRRSSGLEIPSMADLIEQLYAFGAEKDVKWTDEKEEKEEVTDAFSVEKEGLEARQSLRQKKGCR